MNAKSVKSQVTMLVIIGLALFIVVSLVLYLSKSTIKKQTQQNIKRTQETAIETQPIKEFVSRCLDKLTKDAIVLLGKQGGYIYSSQGGTLIDFIETDEGLFFVRHNNLKVAYNILPPTFSVGQYSSIAPDYPWPTFPYETAFSNAEIFDGYFGINNMPPLNISGGPNSIQTQIETFVDSNIAKCMNFEIFEKQALNIDAKQSKTSLTIGSSDVSIKSSIPIKVTNTITNEITELNDFSTKIDIRLKDIYFFINDLISNDIKNIKFDISSPDNNLNSFSVQVIRDVVQFDDLIMVADEKTIIYNKPYEYVFARRNRAPALYYLKKNILEFPQNYELKESDLLQGSSLKAEDPDEDSISFRIIPPLPKLLNLPQVKFKIEVSDDKLLDYQTITVNRK